ncbi:unnamed protein product [Ambrosiozyma monospora]|uniref:Unnamed protein product n=1 Tax=Ambrosiozyma monospora TaxID=43982 RepID=A0A9W6T163_AMBMO|nr:unnamed protein product [Ambrosiozyma monospora]
MFCNTPLGNIGDRLCLALLLSSGTFVLIKFSNVIVVVLVSSSGDCENDCDCGCDCGCDCDCDCVEIMLGFNGSFTVSLECVAWTVFLNPQFGSNDII